MGIMFINSGVPKAGRVGVIADNISPTAGKDTKGGIDRASFQQLTYEFA
jgi:hypothetical protein